MSIIATATTLFSKAKFAVIKHSPEILMGTAIVSGVAATATAIYATPKALNIIDKFNSDMEAIDTAIIKVTEMQADHQPGEPDVIEYTEEDIANDRRLVKTQLVVKMAVNYLPTAVFTATSILSIIAMHNIAAARYAGVVAAYGALNTKFNGYREKVAAEYGEDVERAIYTSDISVKEVDSETGKEVVKQKRTTNKPSDRTDFFFDEYSDYWDNNDPMNNVAYLRSINENLNQQLIAKGHLFLNDVRRAFGLEDTTSGAVMGWVIDKNHPNTRIDLGVFDSEVDPWDYTTNEPWDGRNGIHMDPNVTGIIYDLI